jgi:hypothetical protein
MKYVILRDDDVNALTPTDYLERLYRPFLERRLPVNLAVIPNVSTTATYEPGKLEEFLVSKNQSTPPLLAIGTNRQLVNYLMCNRLFHVVQHGCRHESFDGHYEFDHNDREEIVHRLEEGTRCLRKAGFAKPSTFVAPYDKLSRTSFLEVGRRFKVISCGWYELGRVPVEWWPQYLWKRITDTPHWRAGSLTLLSHPGCRLSYHCSYSSMLEQIEKSIESSCLTVLVTHWWEYFRHGKADEPFIEVLHEAARYLACRRDIEVVSFDDVAEGKVAIS